MMKIHIAHKIYLLLLMLIPFLIMWHLYLEKKGKRHIVYSSRKLFPYVKPTLRIWITKNLWIMKLIALILFIGALSRPQLRNYYDKESKKGIDILISLDISGSMASVDFKPRNRLEVAKGVIANFIHKRSNDRLGLVIFAGTSYTKCPLTVDYDILKYFLKDTEIGELEDGTAIGMALATSVNRIRNSKSRTRIIILLTDGVNNKGEIDPRDAAKIAKDFNVRVYTIGVGHRGKAPYPVIDSNGRRKYMMMNVEIDEKLLQEIANNTGGMYFRATDKNSLQKVFGEIDRWEKTEISHKRFFHTRELFLFFILGGLAFLLLAEILERSFCRSLP